MTKNPGLPVKRTEKAPGDHEITTPELRAWMLRNERKDHPLWSRMAEGVRV